MEEVMKERLEAVESALRELQGEASLGFVVIKSQFKDYLGSLANMIERERDF